MTPNRRNPIFTQRWCEDMCVVRNGDTYYMYAEDESSPHTVIHLLTSNTKMYSHYHVYEFLWAHGGERGEKLLLDRLNRQGRQDGIGRIIMNVYRSPRALDHLRTWLADRRETAKDFSGWCERPRVCDITAGWLMGYTKGAMKFPNGGTIEERDKAVAAVKKQLRDDPMRFEVLRRRR